MPEAVKYQLGKKIKKKSLTTLLEILCLPKLQRSQLSVLCSNFLPQPGSLHVPPTKDMVHCSAQLYKSKEKFRT